MSYYVIGDEDTVLGFRYAGIAGEVVGTAAEAAEAFERCCADETVTTVIIHDAVAKSIRERINRVRFDEARPVVVEIPGVAGPDPERADLMKTIREAVGLSL